MKILFLSYHWLNNSHHSKYGGFHQLVFTAAKSFDVTLITWGENNGEYIDEHGIKILLVKGKKGDFFLKRIRISFIASKIARDFDAIHALHSDCTYFLPSNTYIATFHVLPGVVKYKKLKQNLVVILKHFLLQKRAIKRSKAIVCVSNNLLEKIPKKYQNKAFFIPHGIDVQFWNPEFVTEVPGNIPARYILSVGDHGIDARLFKKIVVKNPDYTFVLIGVKNIIGVYKNVIYMNNVSDEDLKSLYFHSVAVIRPLLFSTANNSILEALAMGKLVITNRIAGVVDYVDEFNCLFIDQLSELSLEGVDNKTVNSIAIRDRAIARFSWEVILGAYKRLYYQKTKFVS